MTVTVCGVVEVREYSQARHTQVVVHPPLSSRVDVPNSLCPRSRHGLGTPLTEIQMFFEGALQVTQPPGPQGLALP